MKREKIIAGVFGLVLSVTALLLAGCEKKDPNAFRIVMENKTGQHMSNFKLYYGTGVTEYEIFSRDYTFAAYPQVPAAPRDISVEYSDESGRQWQYMIDHKLYPEMKYGALYITFLPEGKQKVEYVSR